MTSSWFPPITSRRGLRFWRAIQMLSWWRVVCCRYMLPSDWLDCLAFWRRREKYPQKDIVWEYFSFFEKDTSQASLYSVALRNLTDTLVVNICRHWQRCWSLRELQESYSKALEPILQEQGRVHHGQPLELLTQKPWSPILQEQDRVHHGQPLATGATYSKTLESLSARTRQSLPWPATSYLLKSPGVPFCMKNKTRVHQGQPL